MSTDDTATERTDADDDAATAPDALEGDSDADGNGEGSGSGAGCHADGGHDADGGGYEDGSAPAVDALDQRLVDLLAWVLDTETRARIYVFLRVHPASTSREVAEGTGLYPSTVREALAELNADGTVTRRKRDAGGAGNNPYEYEAVAPADLVADVVDGVEADLNTVYNLDERLAGRRGDADPITITVDAADSTKARASRPAGPDAGAVGDESDAGAVGADDD